MTLLAQRWDKVVDFGSPMTAWTPEMLAQRKENGMSKFTDGPWTSPPNRSQYSNTRDLHDASGKRLAHIQFGAPGREMSDEEIDANARLIAAAPELLAALETVVERFMPCRSDYIFSKRAALDKAAAAIAKATGGNV